MECGKLNDSAIRKEAEVTKLEQRLVKEIEFEKQQADGMPEDFIARRHIGIYAYRVAQLNCFVGWPVAALERFESLEQLRFIANGVGIHVADAVEAVPGGVDTKQDLESVLNIIKSL